MGYKSREEELAAKARIEAEKAQTESLRVTSEIVKAISQPVLHADHVRPTTRRQLISAGLMAGGASLVVPSLLSGRAFAAEGDTQCKAGAGGKVPGYMHFEASGGAALHRNFIFGKQKGGAAFDPLSDEAYRTSGLGTTQVPKAKELVTTFGGTLHATSPILLGLQDVMSAAALAKLVVIGLAGASGDDTSNNPSNPTQLVTKISGNFGGLLQIAGNTDSKTGGRTAPLAILENPGLSKAVVKTEADINNLVDPGLIASRFANDAKASSIVASLSRRLTASKLAQYKTSMMNGETKKLIDCGYGGAEDLLTQFSVEKLAPSKDVALTGTNYGAMTYAQVAAIPDLQTTALISKLVSEGYSTAGTVVIGGYDYHGQTIAAQDAKDRLLGRAIGLALEVAHRKGSAMFTAVTSDGSVSSGGGAATAGDIFQFTGDSGTRGSVLMFAIGATAKPPMNFYQVGAFNAAGSVDTTYLATGSAAATQALNIAYQYAAFIGKMGEFEKSLAAAGAANPFKGSEKDYLAFKDISA